MAVIGRRSCDDRFLICLGFDALPRAQVLRVGCCVAPRLLQSVMLEVFMFAAAIWCQVVAAASHSGVDRDRAVHLADLDKRAGASFAGRIEKEETLAGQAAERVARLAYHANCWGPLGGNAVGVTSIAELTYRTFGDMERAIAEIGEAGYSGVEVFDGNLLDYADRPRELRLALDRAGVQLVAVYSGANFIFRDTLDQELARIARVADAASEMGALHLVVGGGAKRFDGVRSEDQARLAEGLDRVVALAEVRGLRAHYHPHLTTIVEGSDAVDRIFALTPIDFCPDTAHLAAAGADVPRLIRKHAKRISYVHLKGWRKQPFGFTPLDEGDLDIAAILRALSDIAFDGWITAELDSWPEPKQGAVRSLSFASIRRPRRWTRGIL